MTRAAFLALLLALAGCGVADAAKGFGAGIKSTTGATPPKPEPEAAE